MWNTIISKLPEYFKIKNILSKNMKICLNLTKISKGYLDFEKKEKCNFRYSGGGQLTPIMILWTKIESVSL